MCNHQAKDFYANIASKYHWFFSSWEDAMEREIKWINQRIINWKQKDYSMNHDKKSLKNKIVERIVGQGADHIYVVDISGLPNEITRGYSKAILIVMKLSKAFVRRVTETEKYVEKLKESKDFSGDEYSIKEAQTDALADNLADYLTSMGYPSISQSEKRNEEHGVYDYDIKTSILPHKTIAGTQGLGWIGKHNLLVTKDYGSALCMCTVLTNAPLKNDALKPTSGLCGKCSVCQEICPVDALSGISWTKETHRDKIVDVYQCTTCLECMIHCPWTQRYANQQ